MKALSNTEKSVSRYEFEVTKKAEKAAGATRVEERSHRPLYVEN
jgi:hypothetical protein